MVVQKYLLYSCTKSSGKVILNKLNTPQHTELFAVAKCTAHYILIFRTCLY